jgi:carbon starvation protein
MFGTANQLLAGVALAVATSAIINAGKVRYVWVTLLPMLFVMTTTIVACWENIFDNFIPLTADPATATQGTIDILLTSIIMICAVIIVCEACRRWYTVLVRKEFTQGGIAIVSTDGKITPPEYGCC